MDFFQHKKKTETTDSPPALVIVILLFLATCSSPKAYAFDGLTMLDACRTSIKISNIPKDPDFSEIPTLSEIGADGLCDGVIHGINGLNELYEIMTFKQENKNLNLICLPEEISTYQLSRVIVKFLENNPEILHFNGSILASMAISKAFPCQ
jgi:hypothetical protein